MPDHDPYIYICSALQYSHRRICPRHVRPSLSWAELHSASVVNYARCACGVRPVGWTSSLVSRKYLARTVLNPVGCIQSRSVRPTPRAPRNAVQQLVHAWPIDDTPHNKLKRVRCSYRDHFGLHKGPSSDRCMLYRTPQNKYILQVSLEGGIKQ